MDGPRRISGLNSVKVVKNSFNRAIRSVLLTKKFVIVVQRRKKV